MPLIETVGTVKAVGSAIGSVLKRAKAKRKEKKAAKAAAAAAAAAERSIVLAQRAGIAAGGAGVIAAKVTPVEVEEEGGAVDKKINTGGKGFDIWGFVKKNLFAVIATAAALIFLGVAIFKRKKRR
jgi:type II secretory pathway pseudopilin PulG